MFISRELTPDEYGVQAIGMIYFGIAHMFLDTGISIAIIREKNSKVFQRCLRVLLIAVAILLAASLAFAAWPIALWYDDINLVNVLLLYALVLLLNSLPIVEEAILSKNEKFTLIAIVGLITTIVQVGFTYYLAINGFSYYSLIIPLLGVPLIKILVYQKYVDLDKSRTPFYRLPLRASFLRVKSLVGNYTLFRVLAYAASNVDNLYLSKLHSKADLGLYNRAYSFNRLPVKIIAGVVSTVQLPMFQRIKDQGLDVKKEFGSYLQLLGAAGFPAVLIFHLYSYDLSELIWGEAWRQVGEYLYPLSIVLPITLMLNASGNLFVLFRGERLLVYNSVVSSVALIIGASIGIAFSIKGMIIGIIIGYLLGSIPITAYLGFYKLFGFSFWEIIRIWWFNYLTVVFLLLSFVSSSQELTYAVLLVYTVGSIAWMIKYYKENYG
jgi:PST family polysaccharide transporter